MMDKFKWDKGKNRVLKETRSVSFEMIEEAIRSGNILDIVKNKNYEHQKMMHVYVKLKDYVYVVPFEIRDDYIWLITIFPSRKVTKKHRGGDHEKE